MDPYNILGVEKTSSASEIKKAYRKIAQEFHPDKNTSPEAESKFKEASQAYEILSDPQKKAQYDQFGSAGPGGGSPFGGGSSDGVHFDMGGMGDFGDVFEAFFGGGGGQGRKKSSKRGADLQIGVHLTFHESIKGVTKEIEYDALGVCEHCTGKGAEPGTKVKTCEVCHGSGQESKIVQTPLGAIRTAKSCSYCGGSGEVFEKRCTNCGGTGRKMKRQKLKVKIPEGIHDGGTIRLSGKGESGSKGGPDGDLYVQVSVAKSRDFERKGDDLFTEEKVHVLQSILGDEITIKSVEGDIGLKISAGTTDGKMFRLKGYGVPHLKGDGKGDHYITIRIDIPKKLSKKEKELYGELVKESGLEIKAEDAGFFGKFFS